MSALDGGLLPFFRAPAGGELHAATDPRAYFCLGCLAEIGESCPTRRYCPPRYASAGLAALADVDTNQTRLDAWSTNG